MAGPLLETKLHVPRPRRGLVARPRLSERLSRGTESVLTLVSAPAGFGKSTLLAQWLATAAAQGRCVAWLSLDHRDNDPVSFWTYLVAALTTAAHGDDAAALSRLQPPAPPTEAGLATLLNDLHAVSGEVVLVLDDYHVIEAGEVQQAMAFLLEHLPPQIHLVIASRADPTLPLARLRARGELVEIRAAELRFTAQEAAAYLNGSMGLTLTARDVATLEGRTEGWIAALQLAALSLQGREDIAAFIAGFAGDDRYIVDYLAEEVLARQPDQVRRFLLQTCILERLSGPLCDAVTGQGGGKAQLAALERGNLFLVPLDDRRQWYRYHHLFADVLQAHLLDEQPDDVPELHRRASRWYECNGEPTEAIRHALTGGDFPQAANLVESAIPAMRRNRQESAVRGWLSALPEELVRARPVLSVGFAGALLAVGDLDGVESRLRDAERWLDATTAAPDGARGATDRDATDRDATDRDATDMVVVDDEEFGRLPAVIALYRAAPALARGDLPGAVRHAQRAVDLSPTDDHLCRAAAAGLLGLAYWTSGDLAAGYRAYADCMAGLHRAGHVPDTFGCAIALADIRLTEGRLDQALHTYEQALLVAPALTPAHGGAVLRGTADMHTGIADVHRERDDLPAALAQLRRSQELGEHTGLPQNRHRWRVAMARIRQAEGDLDGALDLLDEAQRLYVSDYFPDVRPIPALRARVRIAQGELGDALGWVRERGLSAQDDLSYLGEFEHITVARVLLAQYATERAERVRNEATGLLQRLLHAAEEGERTGTVIEILVVQAMAHQSHGDASAALAALHRAVTLAQPQGYVRIFLDEGPPMVALLGDLAKRGVARSYVRRLLSAASAAGAGRPVVQGLIEPLSERELEVLRLLGTDLAGPDIARELVVSLNTVRTHTKNIYAKLGVNNRRAAVRRAQELDLSVRTR